MAKSSGKVTIKKYANRRLYDTESSTYITLDRLAQMVREGREFQVVDAKTGEDITRQVLTQIIVDEEARGSTYITLDRLAQMVREGREFQVVDAKTGEDITRQVLTQIIVDEEARGSTMLPLNFLKQLIGLYGNSMQNFVPQYLEAAMDAFQRNQSAVKDAFSGNVFADMAKRNMAMFEDAAQAFTGKMAEAKPNEREVDELKAELAALKAKVDKLGS